MRAGWQLYAIVILIFIAIVWLALSYGDKPAAAFDASATLSELRDSGKNTHDALERNIKYLIDRGGIEGALEVVELAFGNEEIFMNDCHSLFHLTGHFAPNFYNDDFDQVVQFVTLKCARGYLHGAEAQIILEGHDVPKRTKQLCLALRRLHEGHECLHGAGHALLNQTLDAHEALDLCNELGAEVGREIVTEKDLAACHEAVFSEITNITGGYDGETGRHFDGDPPIFIATTPLEYCASFDERYHRPCGLEFSASEIGVSTQPSEVEERMQECLADAVSSELAYACFYNIASMYVRHEVQARGDVTFQDWVLDEPRETRLWYILAVGHELAEHLNSGHDVDSNAFCSQFVESDEVATCQEQVKTPLFVVDPSAG